MKINNYKSIENSYIFIKPLTEERLIKYSTISRSIYKYNYRFIDTSKKLKNDETIFILQESDLIESIKLITPSTKKNLDLDRLNIIGIDRVRLYIDIKSMDIDNIPNRVSLGKVTDKNGLKVINKATGEYVYINKYTYTSVENIEFLNNKNYRYKLEIRQISNPSKGINEYKAILDTTMPRVCDEFHNIYNIHTKEDVNYICKIIVNELADDGIEIDLNNAEVINLEINKTFRWKNSIVDEEDVLDYIFKIIRADKSNRKKLNIQKRVMSKEKESFTYSLGTSRIKLKIYSKSEQIINTIGYDSGVHLCRVEITLKKSAIRNSFKENHISILYRIEKLQEVFLSTINDKMIIPLKSGLEKEIKKVETLIIDSNYRTLDKIYKLECRELFDILFLGIAALNVYRKSKNNNFKRDFEKLFNNASKKYIHKYEILINLLSKIMGKKVNLIDIPKKLECYI